MAKGLNKVLFVFFIVVLLAYFYRTAIYWMNYITFDEAVADNIRFRLIELFDLFIVAFIFLNGKFHFRGIHAVCFLWLIVMFFVLLYNGASVSTFFYCLSWPLLFEATYLFVKDKKERVIQMVRFYYIVSVIGLWFFINSIASFDFGLQSNMIYFFVLTIPVLLLKENRTWRIVILILTTVMALLSMKRSMMLAIALFWFVTGLVYFLRNGRSKITVLFTGIVIAVVAYYSFIYIDNLSGGYLTERFEMEDVSNGRENLYENTWNMQLGSSTSEWLLGHGHNAVRDESQGMSAHNEWLEILYDYGAVILLLYLFLWIYLLKTWFYHFKTKSNYLIAYTLSISIFAVMSMVSQLVLYVSYFLYLVMFWGITEALCDTEKLEERAIP